MPSAPQECSLVSHVLTSYQKGAQGIAAHSLDEPFHFVQHKVQIVDALRDNMFALLLLIRITLRMPVRVRVGVVGGLGQGVAQGKGEGNKFYI